MNSNEQPEFSDSYCKKWARAKLLSTAILEIRTLRERWCKFGREYLDKEKTDKDIATERARVITVVERIKPYLDNEGIDYCDQFLNYFRADPPTFKLDGTSYQNECKLQKCLLTHCGTIWEELRKATPQEVIAIQMLDSKLVKGSIREKRIQGVTVEIPSWNCPCGTAIDTETAPMNLRLELSGGEILECPSCARRYRLSYFDGLCGICEIAPNPAL
jgi:hypothetical protein